MATRIGFAGDVAAAMETVAVVDARSEAPGRWLFEETYRCGREEQSGMVKIFTWGEAGVVRIVIMKARVGSSSQPRAKCAYVEYEAVAFGFNILRR